MSRRKKKEVDLSEEAPETKSEPLPISEPATPTEDAKQADTKQFHGHRVTKAQHKEIHRQLSGRAVFWVRKRGRLLEALTYPDGQLVAVRCD